MDEIHTPQRSSGNTEYIIGTQADLEKEHSLLLARVQQIRQQLGWELLPTGRQQRKIRVINN